MSLVLSGVSFDLFQAMAASGVVLHGDGTGEFMASQYSVKFSTA